MKEILHFDSMLTPKLITFIYWILLVASIFGGLTTMFSDFGGISFSSFLMGIVYAVLGMIFARIWCELLIVLFKMNEALQTLKNK